MHCADLKKKIIFAPLVLLWLFPAYIHAQSNLLLNGSFEDINTCTEYKAECGVEGWFYLRDVKAQMIPNEGDDIKLGNNSFGIFITWKGSKDFSPLIGTILPCRLQNGLRYTFKGQLMVKMSNKLIFQPGVVMGEKFYVPKRPFSATLHPDTIQNISPVSNSNYFNFEYSFIATGNERYLTFGTFVEEDTAVSKHVFIGSQTISLTLDNFELVADRRNEEPCTDLAKHKADIYNYNFRHKEMDYSLYGKGEIAIHFDDPDSSGITRLNFPEIKKIPKTDTLKLGDVFFDFNKAILKPQALVMLENFFKPQLPNGNSPIDSIYVEGHTDSIGSDTRNLQLSRQRCEAIQDWLELNSIVEKDRVQIHPFGKTKPIAPNKTPEGRALNRRVEMVVFRRS
jgi:outer membrane protein OmpA-like peptidoglycan-associated protein